MKLLTNLIVALLCASFIINYGIINNNYENDNTSTTIITETKCNAHFNNIRDDLYSEISKFVPTNSNVDIYNVIDMCYKHSFDIPLLMAQAQCESHWGTKGRARRTNSMFGVGAWDNGENKNIYEHVDDSVEPYILHVKNGYLRNNKTVDELLENYVNYNNHRYASNKNYEKQIKLIRNNIINNSNVVKLQRQLYSI